MKKQLKYRTVFISDVHLGTSICQYERLLAFLKSLEDDDGNYAIETLYLNGDIIDMTCMNHKIFWSHHRKILKKFLRMADKNVKILYVSGNHDYHIKEIFDHDFDIDFNGITFAEREIHTTIDGKRYLVLHGDQFDGMVAMNPWLYSLGDFFYEIMVRINKWQNWVRRLFKIPEWSFSLWLKHKAKNAIKFITNFDKLLVEEAKKHNVDGIIAGHIHILKDEYVDGIHSLNSGCWTEFCSCIVEHPDGRMEALKIC